MNTECTTSETSNTGSSAKRRILRGLLVTGVAAVLVIPASVWAADRFSDVPDGNVHHDSINAIAGAGVTQGCTPAAYCPDDSVRRDQMASFLDRLGALSGQDPVVNAATAQQADDSAALGGIDAGELVARLDALEADNEALQNRIGELEATLAGVSRQNLQGRDTLVFSHMNLQVVNGTGTTGGDPNRLGNIIIGYNAPRSGTGDTDRQGSHHLVVGDNHHWTGSGGLLAGERNTTSGDGASVTGGFNNTASGTRASISGGSTNTASDSNAAVSGGLGNTASGSNASVSGGRLNTASASQASVSGGDANTAGGARSSILGGLNHTVDVLHGCHPSC